MNIVWFSWKDRQNPLSGGAEVVTDQLASRLVQDGHAVTLITTRFPKAVRQSKFHGYRIVRVGSRYTSYLAAWRYFHEHRHELKPDLVIDECNTMPFFAGWYTGAPTIMFFHMLCRQIWFYEFPQPLSTIGYLIEPIYLRLLKRGSVIAVSESTKQDLIRNGFKAQDIRIISEGIEMEPVKDLEALEKYQKPTLLSLGAVRAMKRTLDQVRAFELAKTSIPDLQLIVAGDMSSRYGQKVLHDIRNSPHAGDIQCRGPVSEAEKVQLMQRSHIILSTSVKEGWGLTITEAASQGTPAIAYDADGLRDSIRNNQTGWISLSNTPEAVAKQIVAIFNDKPRYSQSRQNAWEWSRAINLDSSYVNFKGAITL